MTELKSCPFCGGLAKVFDKGKLSFYIGCENGCAKTKNYTVYHKTEPLKTFDKTEKMNWAVDAWNTRKSKNDEVRE